MKTLKPIEHNGYVDTKHFIFKNHVTGLFGPYISFISKKTKKEHHTKQGQYTLYETGVLKHHVHEHDELLNDHYYTFINNDGEEILKVSYYEVKAEYKGTSEIQAYEIYKNIILNDYRKILMSTEKLEEYAEESAREKAEIFEDTKPVYFNLEILEKGILTDSNLYMNRYNLSFYKPIEKRCVKKNKATQQNYGNSKEEMQLIYDKYTNDNEANR